VLVLDETRGSRRGSHSGGALTGAGSKRADDGRTQTARVLSSRVGLAVVVQDETRGSLRGSHGDSLPTGAGSRLSDSRRSETTSTSVLVVEAVAVVEDTTGLLSAVGSATPVVLHETCNGPLGSRGGSSVADADAASVGSGRKETASTSVLVVEAVTVVEDTTGLLSAVG
jgi:hypothetical protein